MTPKQIWEGYDPRREPLEEEVIKEWTAEGRKFKEVYFTGEAWEGERVRVYGLYAAPVGARNLPAVLHIHGGGQTVNERWLRFWTGRGYAAMSFNWGGQWPNRKRYTLWGKLVQGNHRQSNHHLVDPSPRINSWYHWALVSRRALTYLEQQPEVDPNRIGAFGVSMGGNLMWYLGMDRRLRAGCAVYCAGWNTYQHEPKYALDAKPLHVRPQIRRWRASMAPQLYAPFVRFPMLYLSATNDHAGNMDRAYDTLAAMPAGVPRRQAFTPRYRHHIGPDQAHNLALWMDAWLKGSRQWPETPTTRVGLSADGVPILTAIPDGAQEVSRVEILYCLENPRAVSRHWRSAESTEKGQAWTAAMPVADVGKGLFAFANVHYKWGICLSSNLEAAIPAQLGKARATDRESLVIYNGSEGVDGWVVNSPGTDPLPPVRVHIRPAEGPGGRRGFRVFPHSSALTYAVGDPKYRGPRGALLSFDVATTTGEEFIVSAHEGPFVPGAREYQAAVSVKGSDGWQTITLSAEQFKETKKGSPLQAWSEITALELKRPRGTTWNDRKIVFARLRWVRR